VISIFPKAPKLDPNCVDTNARKAGALALRRFMSGKITNYDFEALMPETADPAISSIWETAWYYYSDLKKHKLIGSHRLHPEARKQWAKWILFLDSDLPYQWAETGEHLNDPQENQRKGWMLSLKRFGGRGPLTGASTQKISTAQFAAWPFFSQKDYRHALRAPTRLNFKQMP